MTSGTIAHWLKRGWLIRVYAGVYAVGHVPTSPIARAVGAVLACGPGAALSHGSAASLWGIEKKWRQPFEVTALQTHRHDGIKAHRSHSLHPGDITTQLGVRVTTPARTLLDVAPRLTDKRLSRAVNDLLHTKFLQPNDLAEFVERSSGLTGIARLRPFVATAYTPTRSEFEDAFLRFTARYGLPTPEVNQRVAGHEVDALFRKQKLIVELDGYEFHKGRGAFESDRDRDADTLAAGHATVRITWERMNTRPAREADRLRRILAKR
jgi:very-short-patch-repair endonuclease